MINAKLQYFEKIEKQSHQDFINAHNNCILCGSVLDILHVRIEESNSVKEEAHCTHCDIKTRAKTYTLI